MAIDQFQFSSVLLIGLDPVEETQDNADAPKIGTSAADAEQTQKEEIEKASFLDRFLDSDSNNKLIRVPIILDDAFIPAHHVGSSANMNKFVDYDNDKVVVEPASNGLSIQINLKNGISQLSTAADIFKAITGGVFDLFTTSARVSFFSTNTCIFNAYLSGVTRAMTSGSDLETLNLSLENAEPKPPAPPAPGEPELSDVTTARPTPDKGAAGAAGAATTIDESTKTNAGGRLFKWYRTKSLLGIYAAGVPEIFGRRTIEALEYKILYASMVDFSLEQRESITVNINDVYIPLGLDDNYPYYVSGYAVDLLNGVVYLGVEDTE